MRESTKYGLLALALLGPGLFIESGVLILGSLFSLAAAVFIEGCEIIANAIKERE